MVTAIPDRYPAILGIDEIKFTFQGQTIARHGEVRAFPTPTYFGKALMDVRFIFLSIIDATGYESIYPDREERYKERYIYK
jgi:hypothetical protein